ncbi:hypothetical protein conserved [Leishmania donovani]|uniref:Hypothetical_protein_conserved n=1 Tax=Leishmania donovani TaxID=5661 RepID=A0A6J8FQD6_LEIDO|nr:hypothetical protein conserved [Leishmania donovani]VDZ48452.1 hypothetical_protein_conserved [Leishmania donovani]
MSSRRGRQWQSPSGGDDNGLRRDSSARYSSSAHTKPLRYGNGGGFRSNDSRRTVDTSDRYCDMYTLQWGCASSSDGARTARIGEVQVGSTSRDCRRRDASRGSGVSGPGARGRSVRGGNRQYDAPSSWSTSSYTYSYSGSDANNGDSSSEERARDQNRVYAGSRARKRQETKSSRPTPLGSARSPIRVTPTGPPPLDAPPPGAIRWVDDGRRGREVYRGENESKAGSLSRQHTDADEQDAAMMKPAASLRPLLSARTPSLQPTGMLRRVIAAVAYYRGVPPPPSVPPEVILAFDEYVSRGSVMLKFASRGPPHQRFFAIRFLDVMAGSIRLGCGRAYDQRPSILHAVLSWYRSASSRRMIRFLPLHDLIEVKADGADHRYVRRRTVQPGLLRGPRSGLVTTYVRADFIVQFRFCSRLSRAEETLALMAENRTQYLAWLVVGSFISQIGEIY